jgi:uncharacterized protein (DUF433 family)
MNWEDRIHCDPRILGGKPVIRGTRISVELIIQCYASGWSESDILGSYPHLSREDIRAALACAAGILDSQRFLPLGAST